MTEPDVKNKWIARIDRNVGFLKSTSVSCGALGDGAGVTLEVNGGVVAAAEALGDTPPVGDPLGGVSSCAGRKETAHIESNGM